MKSIGQLLQFSVLIFLDGNDNRAQSNIVFNTTKNKNFKTKKKKIKATVR